MKTATLLFSFLFILVSDSKPNFSMAQTETQPYKTIKTEKDFEIRRYPSATMATISMRVKTYKELSSAGFKKLASYIFGGNQNKKSIAMTTPVHMDINDSESTMSFVMPSKYTIENLPKPNDASVTIKTSPEEYVAAIEFGGYADDASIKTHISKLQTALKASGIDYYGHFRFLGYNAPFQFWSRRNEIIVNVHWNKK